MKRARHNLLSPGRMPAMMRMLALLVSAAWILLVGSAAVAQDKSAPAGDELDVTMQIIVDPDAKVPDEVVRRIPLPTRKSPPASDAAGKKANDPAAKDHGNQASEMGSEMSQGARDRAQDANDQREQARRSAADKREREPRPPPEPPRPPR